MQVEDPRRPATPPRTQATNGASPRGFEESVAQLGTMGFSPELCQVAVAICVADGVAGDKVVETALQWLLEQDGTTPDEPRSIECTLNESLELTLDSPQGTPPPTRHNPADSSAQPKKTILKTSSSQSSASNSSLGKKSHGLGWFSNFTLGKKSKAPKDVDCNNYISSARDVCFPHQQTQQQQQQGDPSIAVFKVSNSQESLETAPHEKHVKFSFPDLRISFDASLDEAEQGDTNEEDYLEDYSFQDVPQNNGESLGSSSFLSPLSSLIRKDTLTKKLRAIVHEPSKVPVPSNENACGLAQYYQDCCSVRNSIALPKLLLFLRSLPATCSRVPMLDLSGCEITHSTIHPLLDLLSLNLGLDFLNLDGTGLEDETLKAILQSLIKYSSISTLSLAKNPRIKTNGIKYLSVFIKKAVTISGVCLDKREAGYLSHCIGRSMDEFHVISSSLTSLSLDNCKLRSYFELLVPGIQNSKLEHLSLRQNKLSHEHGPMIAQMLESFYLQTINIDGDSSNYRGIKSLDLRGNELKHGIMHVADVLTWHPALEQINLRDNKLVGSDLLYICKSLQKNRTLKAIDLSANQLFSRDEAEIAALKECLTGGTCLEEIYLDNVNLSCECAIALAESLPMLRNLRVMYLRFNPMELGGVMAIGRAVPMNKTLVELEMTPIQGQRAEDEDFLVQILSDISGHLENNLRPERDGELTLNDLRYRGFIENIPVIQNSVQLLDEMVGNTSQLDIVEQLYHECLDFQAQLREFDESVRRDAQVQGIETSLERTIQKYRDNQSAVSDYVSTSTQGLTVPTEEGDHLRKTSTTSSFSLSGVDELLKNANIEGDEPEGGQGQVDEQIDALLATERG